MTILRISTVVLLAGPVVSSGRAADPQPQAATQEKEPAEQAAAELQRNHKQFEQLMSGVKLVGQFTVLGKEQGPLPKEEYTIKSVKKMPAGDYWLFNARIKYGNHDVTLPLPLEVKWAADTPVITLSELAIPGLGTFSSRVVIYNKKYAGTWTHGKVGGHLFGTLEELDPN